MEYELYELTEEEEMEYEEEREYEDSYTDWALSNCETVVCRI